MTKRPKEGERLVGDYRRQLVERLFSQMFDERFSELAQRPDAKFLGAGVGGGPLGRDVTTFEIGAASRTAAWPKGSRPLPIEAEAPARVRLHARRARSRQARPAQLLRARVQRARQDRQRPVRRRVPAPLLHRRADPGHRLRVPPGPVGAADDHA